MPGLPKRHFFVRLYALNMEKPEIETKSDKTNPQGPKMVLNKSSFISLSFELGYIIALPLVLFGLAGRWADNRLHHEFPWITLIGIAIAIASTTMWLTKRLSKYLNK